MTIGDRITAHRKKASIGTVGRASEKRTAKRLGARLTAASGARHEKADMTLGEFRVEAKATERASYTLKLDDLLKVVSEAQATGRTAALSVSFVDPAGRPRTSGAWVLVPEWWFHSVVSDV